MYNRKFKIPRLLQVFQAKISSFFVNIEKDSHNANGKKYTLIVTSYRLFNYYR